MTKVMCGGIMMAMSDEKHHDVIDTTTTPELVEAAAPQPEPAMALVTGQQTGEAHEEQRQAQPAIVGAPIWKRSIAAMIDITIMALIPLMVPIALLVGADVIVRLFATQEWLPILEIISRRSGLIPAIGIPLLALFYAPMPLIYFCLLEAGKNQATLGKRLMGLKAIRFDGSTIDVQYTLKRMRPKLLFTEIVAFGMVLAAFGLCNWNFLPSITFITITLLVALYGTTLFSKSRLTLTDRQWGRAVVEATKEEFRRPLSGAEIGIASYLAIGAAMFVMLLRLDINLIGNDVYAIPKGLKTLNTSGGLVKTKAAIPAAQRIAASDLTVEHRGRLFTPIYTIATVDEVVGKYPRYTLPAEVSIMPAQLVGTMPGITFFSDKPMEGNDRWQYSLKLCNRELAKYDENKHPYSVGEAYSARGWVYYKMGDYAKALADLNKAEKLLARSSVYMNRARVYLAQGELKKALADCDDAVLDSEVEAYQLRAQVHRRMGNEQLAKDDEASIAELRFDQREVEIERKRKLTEAAVGFTNELHQDQLSSE
jgi:tetratricopeptide (TPR) repeat protein